VFSVILADANTDGMLDVIAGTKGSAGYIYVYLYAGDLQTTVSTAGLTFIDFPACLTFFLALTVLVVFSRYHGSFNR
ncbi:MAG: hypothetical protein ACTSP4_12815, partial [Candidatus Hodarchaeales archaeon]